MAQTNNKVKKNSRFDLFTNSSAAHEGKVVLALMVLAGCFICLTFVTAWISFTNRALAVRGQTFVQLNNGSAVEAQEEDENFRSEEVLQEAVARWTQLTFEWDNTIPNSTATDQGYEVGSDGRITSRAYFASYLLEDGAQGGFREEFLEKLGELTPGAVFDGSVKSVVRIYDVSKPRRIAPGKWEVDLVATRYLQGQTDGIEFNRTFTLQAVRPASLALGEEEPSAYRRQIYSLLSAGLIITEIVPIQ